MCLAIPALIREMPREAAGTAVADVLGVRRRIWIDLLEPVPSEGDWVLVHVGIALARISESDAREQLDALEQVGEAQAARDEIAAEADVSGGGP